MRQAGPTFLFARSVALIIALAATAAFAPRPQPEPMIAPAGLAADLDILESSMRDVPQLHRYVEASELDRLFADARGSARRAMTEREFFSVVAPIVARVRNGHMFATASEATATRLYQQTPLFPLMVETIDGRPYVFRDLTEAGLAGAEILTVNGRPAADLVEAVLRVSAIDAGLASERDRMASGVGFSYYLALLLDMTGDFDVTLRKDGEIIHRRLHGVVNPLSEWRRLFPADRPVRRSSPISLTHTDDGVAVLRIPHWDFDTEVPLPADVIDGHIRDLAERRPRALIIDLRDNGGGDDALSSRLLSYLLPDPFFYYRCASFVTDSFGLLQHAGEQGVEYRGMMPQYVTEATPECRPYGGWRLTNRPNNGLQALRQPHYPGPVYVLVNDGSFSTSVEFVAQIRSKRRGLLIGSTPHGSYWSNTSGITPTITLPNSGLRVDLPLIFYLHGVEGDLPLDSGVVPDIEVRYTIQERISGVDKEMAVALALIRQGP